RPCSAHTRYLAACAALALMAACPGLTLLTTGPARDGEGSGLLHRRGAESAAWTQPSSVPTGTAFSGPALPGPGPGFPRWEEAHWALPPPWDRCPVRGQGAAPPPLRLRGEYAVLLAPGSGARSSLAATLEPLLPGLVVLWLAGVLLLSLRFLGGW